MQCTATHHLRSAGVCEYEKSGKEVRVWLATMASEMLSSPTHWKTLRKMDVNICYCKSMYYRMKLV